MPRGSASSLPKLPVKQLTILAICRFAEPISLTSIFPYLPEMIQSFDIPEQDIAFWAGLTSAIYSLAQCLTAIPWGRASDRFGRKYVILLGLTNTMITSLLWGFSTNLPLALTARALSGAGNGNVGIIRTMVAELCPWRELQPRAFSIMPLVYNIGSVLGPAFGGALSNPLRKDPGDRRQRGGLLWTFPYSLPNLVAAGFFLVGITVGTLFLEETLAAKKERRDWGLVLGNKVKGLFKSGVGGLKRRWTGEESEPLLSSEEASYHTIKDEETPEIKPNDEDEKPVGYREVLSRQTVLNLLVYTLLAMHAIAFDQLLPVFMHHPRSGPDVGETQLPLKFSYGFGIGSGPIGFMFTCYGVVGIFYQFVVFPPLARKYGVLRCLRIVLTVMPIIYFIAPFSTLVPSVYGAQSTLFAIWLVKGICSTFAFPCSTILLTNTAPSLKVLGTINGIATSVSAIGRAAGPTIGGSVFTWGVKKGYIIAPFWTLAAIATLAPIASLYLVEGEGFGDPESGQETEEEDGWAGEEDEDRKPSQTPSSSKSQIADSFTDTETDDEVGPLLSRQSTISRSLSRRLSHRNSYDSDAMSETDEEAEPVAMRQSRWEAEHVGQPSHLVPTRSRRRSSAGLGMGPGFRRASSNLGQTRSGLGGMGGLDAFTRT